MKHIVVFLIVGILIWSCGDDDKIDPYLIGKQNIGFLTDSTQVRELAKIFANDSIAYNTNSSNFGSNAEIDIFSADGSNLLSLTPIKPGDSTSLIGSVQIKDPAFKTKLNISTLSTFKDINENYKISKVNNLINSIVISVPELNASFTIDKMELPPNLRYDVNMKIEKAQIPDNAKIKYFMLHWE